MLNKKVLIGLIIALIAIIVVGFVALNLVPTFEVIKDDSGDNLTDGDALNITEDTLDDLNLTVENDTDTDDDDANDTNASSDIDPGDVLHKQTFTVSENETGQNQGMEPGKYVMYYTNNDGPIKIVKIA